MLSSEMCLALLGESLFEISKRTRPVDGTLRLGVDDDNGVHTNEPSDENKLSLSADTKLTEFPKDIDEQFLCKNDADVESKAL